MLLILSSQREISENTATGIGMFSGVCVAHCLIWSVHMIARAGTRINTVWQQQTAHEDVHFQTFVTRNTQSNIQILTSHLNNTKTEMLTCTDIWWTRSANSTNLLLIWTLNTAIWWKKGCNMTYDIFRHLVHHFWVSHHKNTMSQSSDKPISEL